VAGARPGALGGRPPRHRGGPPYNPDIFGRDA
jgi:hypothetical protein